MPAGLAFEGKLVTSLNEFKHKNISGASKSPYLPGKTYVKRVAFFNFDG